LVRCATLRHSVPAPSRRHVRGAARRSPEVPRGDPTPSTAHNPRAAALRVAPNPARPPHDDAPPGRSTTRSPNPPRAARPPLRPADRTHADGTRYTARTHPATSPTTPH